MADNLLHHQSNLSTQLTITTLERRFSNRNLGEVTTRRRGDAETRRSFYRKRFDRHDINKDFSFLERRFYTTMYSCNMNQSGRNCTSYASAGVQEYYGNISGYPQLLPPLPPTLYS
ncbi:MAG: hypothetical protein F6J96_14485 [Symploca sp. SIO1C2]|nr:hypothetical protein [Symploca sp. SIO1C2]